MPSNHYIKRFNNGFGFNAATYEAKIEADCETGTLQCLPSVSATDNTPMMSATKQSSVRKVGHCCYLDFAFVGTGGWPDITIKWNSKNVKFEITVGGYGWKYFDYSGTIRDCCSRSDLRTTTDANINRNRDTNLASEINDNSRQERR